VRWFGKPGSRPGEASARNYLSLRINLFFFGTFFIFCIVIIRLAGLQFVESPELAEAEASRETKDVPLAARTLPIPHPFNRYISR
jgi:cell division protein FtsI/penicillin-binding protein 2